MESTAECLVLKRSDSGESDRRLTVFTSEYGKLDLIAKGARKGGSRLAGSSEPLTLAKMHFAVGRQRRFITQVEPITSFPQMRSDYHRLLAALAWCELLAGVLPYESPAPELFDLSKELLAHVAEHEDPVISLAWGMAVVFESEGQSPDWLRCIVTDAPLELSPAWVSPAAGGYVDPSVAGQFHDRFVATSEALIALKRLVEIPAPPAKLRDRDEVIVILERFWGAVLERPLPALRALIQATHSDGE